MSHNFGGMVLKEENQGNERKISPSATLSTTNPTWTGLILNLGLCCERLVSDHVSHGGAWDVTLQVQQDTKVILICGSVYHTDGMFLMVNGVNKGKHKPAIASHCNADMGNVTSKTRFCRNICLSECLVLSGT
jgi:hypothetical protein